MTPIYLDYNATTPLDPAVLDAMLPYLREHCGNPSSTHAWERPPMKPSNRPGSRSPQLLGAQPDEIVFTGGGTEASNHALKGVGFRQIARLFRPLGARSSSRHQRRRASGHDAAVRVPEAARLPGHGRAGRWAGAGRSRRGAQARSSAAPRSSASCTPTTRSAPCSRSGKSPR